MTRRPLPPAAARPPGAASVSDLLDAGDVLLHPESVPVDPRTLERVRQLLAERDDVEEKRMVGGRSFVVGGQLCCGVNGQGLVVRLGTEGVARAREQAHVRPLMMGDKEVGAFAVVDPEGYPDDEALAGWVSRAVAFVEGIR
jgi:hypothetical protein